MRKSQSGEKLVGVREKAIAHGLQKKMETEQEKEKTSVYIRARTGQQGDTNERLLSGGDAVEI